MAALAPGCGSRKVCDRVEALHARLREEGLPLALGVSTPAHGVAELPRAFAEARAALECVDGDGGVAALPLMSPLRYLTLSAPDTARRLVDPRLRTFLEQDRGRGGALRDTIRALAETDLKLGRGRRAPAGAPEHAPVPRAPDPGAHGPQSAPRRRPARAAHGDRAR